MKLREKQHGSQFYLPKWIYFRVHSETERVSYITNDEISSSYTFKNKSLNKLRKFQYYSDFSLNNNFYALYMCVCVNECVHVSAQNW